MRILRRTFTHFSYLDAKIATNQLPCGAKALLVKKAADVCYYQQYTTTDPIHCDYSSKELIAFPR